MVIAIIIIIMIVITIIMIIVIMIVIQAQHPLCLTITYKHTEYVVDIFSAAACQLW